MVAGKSTIKSQKYYKKEWHEDPLKTRFYIFDEDVCPEI